MIKLPFWNQFKSIKSRWARLSISLQFYRFLISFALLWILWSAILKFTGAVFSPYDSDKYFPVATACMIFIFLFAAPFIVFFYAATIRNTIAMVLAYFFMFGVTCLLITHFLDIESLKNCGYVILALANSSDVSMTNSNFELGYPDNCPFPLHSSKDLAVYYNFTSSGLASQLVTTEQALRDMELTYPTGIVLLTINFVFAMIQMYIIYKVYQDHGHVSFYLQGASIERRDMHLRYQVYITMMTLFPFANVVILAFTASLYFDEQYDNRIDAIYNTEGHASESILLAMMVWIIVTTVPYLYFGVRSIKSCKQKLFSLVSFSFFFELIVMVLFASYIIAIDVSPIYKKYIGFIIFGKASYQIMGLIVDVYLYKDMANGLSDVIAKDSKVGPQERTLILD